MVQLSNTWSILYSQCKTSLCWRNTRDVSSLSALWKLLQQPSTKDNERNLCRDLLTIENIDLKNSPFSLALSIKQQLSALFLSPRFIPRHRCEKSAWESRNSHHLIKQRDNIHARTHDTCVIRADICRHDGAICSKNRKIVPYHRCARIPRLTVSVPDYGSWFRRKRKSISPDVRMTPFTRWSGNWFWKGGRVRYIMLENSSIMLLSVTQKNLVLCPKLRSKNIALCSPDFYCIQHVLITTV